MFRTVEAERFFAAWQALRVDNDFPHYRRLFQELPPDMLPQLVMVEQQQDERYIVRFMGTTAVEFWRADLTGQDILGTLAAKVANTGRRNYAALLGHPCGMHNIGVYTVPSREELPAEGVMVPVSNDPKLPLRILGFVQQIPPPYTDRPDLIARAWLDLGYGTPARNPAV